MAGNGSARNGDSRAALRRIAAADPDLAARMVVQALPAAAATLPETSYALEVEGVGRWRVHADGAGGAEVMATAANAAADGEEFAIATDARGLARLAGGANPLLLALSGRLRVSGHRRRALVLRHLSADAGLREAARLGAPIDPDLVFRSLAHAIDPRWTSGHSFSVVYELIGEGGGRWHVIVADGEIRAGAGGPPSEPDAIVRTTMESWLSLLRGEVTPSRAMQLGLTEVDGNLYAVTLMGRWIDRVDGRDDPELEREQRQRDVQASRAGTWGGRSGDSDGGDPAAAGRPRRELLGYDELYALWERQNWRVQDLDFSLDARQWAASPAESQQHTGWTIGSFYVGEERVTADLAPFLLAAPSGEVEAFLATQLVDEARHAVFFDRWAAEVMALSAGDLRGRLGEMEERMGGSWHFLFDESLREVANRIKARPDDLELFVEGIVTYHMVTEGVLAMPGQRAIIQYAQNHGMYPGFVEGFSLVERDEHRHIAFGVRFLRDVCEERPEMRSLVLRTLERLLPQAAEVFCPPEADDPADFFSYGYHSSQIYGFAYSTLKRRMGVIGVEIPAAEELMPGPVDLGGLRERRPLAELAAS